LPTTVHPAGAVAVTSIGAFGRRGFRVLAGRRIRAASPDGVDESLVCVGTEGALDVSLDTVIDRNRSVTIVTSDRAAALAFQSLNGTDSASLGYRNGRRSDLVAMAARSELTVVIARTLPLSVAHARGVPGSGRTLGRQARAADPPTVVGDGRVGRLEPVPGIRAAWGPASQNAGVKPSA